MSSLQVHEPKPYIALTVYGLPRPQGNKRGFLNKATGRIIIVEKSGAQDQLKPWRQEISGTAKVAMVNASLPPLPRNIGVQANLIFYFPRPKSLKKSVTQKTTKPDLSKLTRAVEDAMTGIVYEDDSQICREWLEKKFDGVPRLEIEIWRVGE